MNILHLATYLQGGAGKLITDLLVFQKSIGHNVFLIISDSEYTGYCNYPEYIETLKNFNINYLKIDSLFKRDLLLNLQVSDSANKIIQRNNIELIHTHASIPSYIALLARTSVPRYIPIIQTIHGWGNNKSPEHEAQEMIILNRIDQVVVVSKSLGTFLKRKKIYSYLIYNGIKEKPLSPPSPPSHLKKYLTTCKKNNIKIIGHIGSLCKRKNQILLIKAIKELTKSRNDISCLFIGEKNKSYMLDKIVNEHQLEDHIYFAGYQENASDYIGFFDILCLPSLSEGHSLCLLEGFRDMTPVLCSNIPAFTEVISNNYNGFLFESENTLSLSANIIKILNLNKIKKNNILEFAQMDYYKKYSFNTMVKNYEDLYTKLCNLILY